MWKELRNRNSRAAAWSRLWRASPDHASRQAAIACILYFDIWRKKIGGKRNVLFQGGTPASVQEVSEKKYLVKWLALTQLNWVSRFQSTN